MSNILSRLLQKRGISNPEDLSIDEKNDFERWRRVLSDGEITIDKVTSFCDNQIGLIEGQWKDLSNTNQKNERLILLHTVYKAIKNVIVSPQAEREALEKYLQQMIDA